jgi:hypothetical protein
MRSKSWIQSGVALVGAALAICLLALPSTSSAFSLTGIGPRLGVTDPDGVDGTVAFGGGLDFQQSDTRFHLQPNVLYWSNEGLSDVNPNFDVMYHFQPAGHVSPYAGAGLGLHFYGSEGPGDPGTDLGANLFGGVLLPTHTADFFVEGRAVVSDRDQLGIYTGANFILGR